MAELVDALVSNTSAFTGMPVRLRLWVHPETLTIVGVSCFGRGGITSTQQERILHQFINTKPKTMNYKFEKPVVATIGTEKYKIEVAWRNGQLIADEPVTSGGKDLGPDPFTLLLSSLATCTLATLRMYIDHKDWDIKQIKVEVNLFEVVKDGERSHTIDRDLHFEGAITDAQRQRLIEVAGSCPISKLLKGEVHIRTFVYNAEPIEKKVVYKSDALAVEWNPELCKHSARCVSGLPTVFDVNAKPWINMQGASAEAIAEQVQKCPTGALRVKK